jgi:hypothetical protein
MERKQNRWILGAIVGLALISATQLFSFAGLPLSRPLVNAVIFGASVFGLVYIYSALASAVGLTK